MCQCEGQPLLLQAIIGNYAVPILEEKQVWGTTDETRTAYLDTTDVAKMTLAALRCVLVWPLVCATSPACSRQWSFVLLSARCVACLDCSCSCWCRMSL